LYLHVYIPKVRGTTEATNDPRYKVGHIPGNRWRSVVV
jgi:hypothetical protein